MSLSQSAEVLLRAGPSEREDAPAARPEGLAGVSAEPIALSVTSDIDSVAAEWQAFERVADCTAFQTFAWQSTWLRRVGVHQRVTPAIVIGRDSGGAILFLMPLAVEAGKFARRLVWLASDLCDYNGPLLAPDFASRVAASRFVGLWREITALLQAQPNLRFDVAVLDKLPETVGAQPNPFLALNVRLNPSGAHFAHLGGDWESFHLARRSSATRRRDRTRRKRLGELGDLRFVTPADAAETLETLFVQKAKSFARMGVANLFARPGVADFFRDIAGNPGSAGLAHVSRLDVGPMAVATNLGLVFRGRYYHVLASYDDGPAARFGPGTAHLQDLMGYAIDRGCDIFDFTIGDEPYKRDWSDSRLTLYDHGAPATLRGWAVALPAAIRARVKRTIKQTPLLWRAFTAVRAGIGALRRRNPVVDEEAECQPRDQS